MTPPTNEFDEARIFDHEYDGIREYDNPMPRWWVWMFWLCIVFAVPYLMWYHIGVGPSIHDKLETEQAEYAAVLIAQYGELEANEPTIVAYMNDEIAMTGMSSLFKSKCAQCHLADGSGNVGPNLTDDSFINVKQVTDIAKIIREGLVEKGMPIWGDKLTETQIALLSAYVASMRGKNVTGGKAPQGTPIPPWPPAPADDDQPTEG